MVTIAPATVDDCRQCAALLVGQLSEHGVDASAKQLAQVLENVVADAGRGYLLLARESGRIIGVAYVATILSAEHCGLVGWLEELYVLPEHRSRGVGTALLTAILEIIRPSIGSGAIISLRKRETSCYLLLRQPNDAKEHADAKS